MRNIIAGGVLIALTFTAGYVAGVTHEQLKITDSANSIMQQGLNHVAEDITVFTTSMDTQRNREAEYAKNIQTDITRTEVLLNRVMQYFDRMYDPSLSARENRETPASGDTCTPERAEARKLSGQLRETLEQYGNEARRANENTRLLNECIAQLALDHEVWNQYHF
jgi:hypothetical protein